MKRQRKCYLYTRVSTAIQVDGYRLNAQKDKLRKYAEYQDMTIVSKFSDAGFSGKNIKGRPEFLQMMENIESGEGTPVYMGKITYGRRRTEKKADTRNEMHVVEQSEYPIYEGVHEAIMSESDWHLAQQK